MSREMRQEGDAYKYWLADGFDIFTDGGGGRAPEEMIGDELLRQYVRDVVRRNPNLGGADPKFRESFKENLQQFVGEMKSDFSRIDSVNRPEQMLMSHFQNSSTENRRRLWKQVVELADKRYSPEELNAKGYDRQLNDRNESQIFQMFINDWIQANRKHQRSEKERHLAQAATKWEKACSRTCAEDFEARRHVSRAMGHYPLLAEIARIIGRDQSIPTAETTRMSSQRRSSTSSATRHSFEEIDRITSGNNIDRIIPSEYSYLTRPETEIIFLDRYARKQLQQFSAPDRDLLMKCSEHASQPRRALGPIIVSVDTSSSMSGRPLEIAFAMVHQLIEIARKGGRKCYLITFAVNSRAIDLSQPRNWRQIDEFLSKSHAGGTSGEEMFRDAIARLHTDNYSMADVLIISDFAFATPLPDTLAAIRREQALDTRFYGLKIGLINTPYSKILNRIWTLD
ncbi:MAG: hypothetical protein K2G08_02280 [Paramuribaculum sp.]|nr:hypothetical protein [Paramuribaculum sp.]